MNARDKAFAIGQLIILIKVCYVLMLSLLLLLQVEMYQKMTCEHFNCRWITILDNRKNRISSISQLDGIKFLRIQARGISAVAESCFSRRFRTRDGEWNFSR